MIVRASIGAILLLIFALYVAYKGWDRDVRR